MMTVKHIFPSGHETHTLAINVEYERPVLRLNLGLGGLMNITHGVAIVYDQRKRKTMEYDLSHAPIESSDSA